MKRGILIMGLFLVLLLYLIYSDYQAITGINAYIHTAEKLNLEIGQGLEYNYQDFNTVIENVNKNIQEIVLPTYKEIVVHILRGLLLPFLLIIPLTAIYLKIYSKSKNRNLLIKRSMLLDGAALIGIMLFAFLPSGTQGSIIEYLIQYRDLTLLLLFGVILLSHSLASAIVVMSSNSKK